MVNSKSGAGYTEHRPLEELLYYRSGQTVYPFQAPDWFRKWLADKGLLEQASLPAMWAHGFFKTMAELEAFLEQTDLTKLEKGLSICLPEGASAKLVPQTIQAVKELVRPKVTPLGMVGPSFNPMPNHWWCFQLLRPQ